MNHWALAFVGDHAQDNYGATQKAGVFCISSDRTPVRRARPNDRALLYLAGQGFVAEAEISSSARSPQDAPDWSSKKPPSWAVSVSRIRTFPEPVPYKFPGKGNHPVLGFHRYALTGGFVEMSPGGFEDVLGRAYPHAAKKPQEPRRETPAEADPRANEETAPPVLDGPAKGRPPDRRFEKRAAGQHALAEGRKRSALWTVAEIGASAIKWRGAEKFAGAKAREAERTWIAGGRAEERVGAELEKLAAHGFYVFHDVALPELGNVDHVVLGEKGFFCVETKSHKGQVSSASGALLLNGRPTEKDFVKQTWRGCYRLRGILDADVTPLLLFTDAFVRGRLHVRGVRVLPLEWLVGEILGAKERHDRAVVKTAVNALGNATGCYPSSTPRLA